jgi:glycosyltransferase involved in cell wall biosynthesis
MIAYFVYNLNSYSGAAFQALNLSRYIQYDIVIFNKGNNNFSKIYESNNLTIVNLPKNSFISSLLIIWYYRIFKIKIVHFHGFFLMSLIISIFLRKFVILKTTLYGDDDFDSLNSKFFTKIFLYFFKNRIDVNICLTNQLKTINLKYLRCDKIHLIPNGVKIAPNPLVRKNNIFCFVGVICKRKNTLEAINYFLKNYSDLDDAQFFIVGPDGNTGYIGEEDVNYVKQCKFVVDSHKNGNKVVFTGLLSSQETINIMYRSKALIFFSKREGMPNVVLEAIANNCIPITSSALDIMYEILPEELHNFILKDWNECIDVKLLDYHLNCLSFHSHAQKYYNLNKVADIYNSLYFKAFNV